MRNGISAYGRYESSGWTRCTAQTTQLNPTASQGVFFGPSIVSPTVLDGFVVFANSPAITLDGARNAVLSSLEIPVPPAFR
jgi:hypothetical protein